MSDGLKNIPAKRAEDIIICGMGGELISRIILDCPYAMDKSRHFVLQPMTNIPFLRESLYENGFFIEKEDVLFENSHDYTVLSVYYGGEKVKLTPVQAILGKIKESDSDYKAEYLDRLYNKYKKIADGLKKSKGNEEQIKANDLILEGLEKIIKE